MSEPCRHERSDELTSFVGTVRALVKAEHERDAALAALARVRVLGSQWERVLDRGSQWVPTNAVIVDLLTALEPTDLPKGSAQDAK